MAVPADNPITSKNQDRLGRTSVARVLAQEIRSLDASEGCVVGILGPWGSGKTSLIELVRNELLERPAVPVLEFNPWLFSGADQLLESFFLEVGAQFRGRADQLSSLAEDLETYAEFVAPLKWLPIVGPWVERATSITKMVKKARERRRGGALRQREQLARKLSDLQIPVLIVIDDIDRLRTSEIREIFKLVRLTANFPNIIYLLAFDRHRVEKALSEEGLDGRDYLEKILQVAHDIPAMPEAVITRILTESLDEALTDIESPGPFSTADWPDALFEIVRPLIRNMRDVRRYVAAVHGTIRGLEGRIELVDVFALEAIRVFLPDVFKALPTARHGLTAPSSRGMYGHSEPPGLKASVEDLIEVAQSRGDVVRSLIHRIFPSGRRHIGNNYYGPEFQGTWLRERRVAHLEVLNLYLERIAGEKLQAFSDAEQLFQHLADEKNLASLLSDLSPEQLADTIASLEVYEGEFPEEGIATGASALLNQIHRMPKRQGGLLGFSSELVVDRVVLRMLRQLGGPEEIKSAVQTILPRLHQLSDRYSLIRLVGYQENAGHELISEASAADLENELSRQIHEASASVLARERDLLRLLYWTPKAAPELGPVAIPEDPAVMSSLLKASLAEVWSQSMDTRAANKSSRLYWDVLVEVADGEASVGRMVEMTEHLAAIDPELAEARHLAEKYLGGWRPSDFGADE